MWPASRLPQKQDAPRCLARERIGRFALPLRTLAELHLAAAFANDLASPTSDGTLARRAQHFGVKHRRIS